MQKGTSFLPLARLDDLPNILEALSHVWVNIRDFLDAVRDGTQPYRHPSEKALAQYTIKTHKVYPKKMVTKGSPLRKLLAHIF